MHSAEFVASTLNAIRDRGTREITFANVQNICTVGSARLMGEVDLPAIDTLKRANIIRLVPDRAHVYEPWTSAIGKAIMTLTFDSTVGMVKVPVST